MVAEDPIARATEVRPYVEEPSRCAHGMVEVAELDDEVEVAASSGIDELFEPSFRVLGEAMVDVCDDAKARDRPSGNGVSKMGDRCQHGPRGGSKKLPAREPSHDLESTPC